MADESGEPVKVTEVPDDNVPIKAEEIGKETTEENVGDINPEINTPPVNIVEAEPNNGDQDGDEHKESQHVDNQANVEINENVDSKDVSGSKECIASKEQILSKENIESKDQIGSKEHIESKEQIGSKEHIESKEHVKSKTDLENIETEQTPVNEQDEENINGAVTQKDQVKDEIEEEENIEDKEVGEEHDDDEQQQAEAEQTVGEENIYEEIEEEIENEDGTKTIKNIKRKKQISPEPIPLEQVMVEVDEEELLKEEEKTTEEVPVTHEVIEELVEEEQIPEDLPPDPAAPLDYSDSKEALKPRFRLRPDQTAELESLWELYQNYTPVYTDIDGYITEKELVYMLKALLLMTYTPEQLQELITFVCRPAHPKGHITYDQFLKMVTLRQRDLSIEDELRNSMKVMDFDNTGTVERDFFKETLMTKGYRMTTRMVDYLIKEVDITNDGTLGVEDVVGTMSMDLNPEDLEMLRKAIYPDENVSVEEEQEEAEGVATEDKSDEDDDDDD